MKKGVLKNFAKLTGKHLCQSLFFNKAAGVSKFFKDTFFTEHLWASEKLENIRKKMWCVARFGTICTI